MVNSCSRYTAPVLQPQIAPWFTPPPRQVPPPEAGAEALAAMKVK